MDAFSEVLRRISRSAPGLAREIRRRMALAAEEAKRRGAWQGGAVPGTRGVGHDQNVGGGGGGGDGRGGVGGDGGGGWGHARENARVVLTMSEGDRGVCVTADVADTAHLCRDPTGKFLPASSLAVLGMGSRGVRRRYPVSQMLSSGVSIDSGFDATAARSKRLRADLGVDLVGVRMGAAVEAALWAASRRRDGIHGVIGRNRDHERGRG